MSLIVLAALVDGFIFQRVATTPIAFFILFALSCVDVSKLEDGDS